MRKTLPSGKPLPKYMAIRDNGSFILDKVIPRYAWNKFPELTGENQRRKWITLGDNYTDALILYGTRLGEIQTLISQAKIERTKPKPAEVLRQDVKQPSVPLFKPAQIETALKAWGCSSVRAVMAEQERRELQVLNGYDVEPVDGTTAKIDRALSLSSIHNVIANHHEFFKAPPGKSIEYYAFDDAIFEYARHKNAFLAVPEFNTKLVEALKSQGIEINPDAPILNRVFAVSLFSKTWADVLKCELNR